MSNLVRVLTGLLAARDELIVALEAQWPAFQEQLDSRLRLIVAADDTAIQSQVNELLTLCLRSPARPVVVRLLREAHQAPPPDNQSASWIGPPGFDEPALSWWEAQEVREAARSLLLALADESAFSPPVPSAPDPLRGLPATPEPLAPGAPETETPRYLNTGLLTLAGERVPTDRPLARAGEGYLLGVNVGAPWSPGEAGPALPEAVIGPLFAGQRAVTFDVHASSDEIEIEHPHRQLLVPREGESELLTLALTLRRSGRQALQVDLLYHGHLIQSRRLEVFVVETPEESAPASAWPLQDSRVTFTRTALVSPEAMAPMADQPRRRTIVAERIDGQIGLRFYRDGAELAFYRSELTDTSLGRPLAALRVQLELTMRAYAGGIGGSAGTLTAQLGQLASRGNRFYNALFPNLDLDPERAPARDLPAGSVIQVAPLTPQLSVPWELIYDRPVESYREGRTRLCPSFREHGPDGCPHADDPGTVCPYGFWGYRYTVEQLPCRVEPNAPPPAASLALRIANAIPLRLSAIVYTGFRQLAPHLRNLQALAPESQLSLARIDSFDEFRTLLSGGAAPADMLYFYAHGGTDDSGSPYLKIGAGDHIFNNDLSAWRINLRQRQPFIIFNACESAGYSPDSFESLIQFFAARGAAGVIGTQCEVQELLAGELMLRFFRGFLAQVPAGRALFDARLSLLREALDPRGLAYSLFAAAEVVLDQPVIAVAA
ncbi:MAG: hypothetical protein OHK0015_04430 [Chloroflexi bacterium OHK40]